MTEQKSLKPVQVTVFFPSSMDVSEDRARWYLDHAIRGYWQKFATETDPICQMSKCSVSVSPLTAAPASAAEPVTDFTEWERSQIASWAAGNAMTYMQHSVIGKGLNDHEKVQMENWKALHDKLKRT